MLKINKKKTLKGTVVASNSSHSVVVLVSRSKLNKKYHKRYTVSNKYIVDCEKKQEIGQIVVIEETRPISKKKKFRLIED